MHLTINSAKDGPKPVTNDEEGLFCFASTVDSG